MTGLRDRLTHPAALCALAALVVAGAATATPWQLDLPDVVLPDRPDVDTASTPSPPPSAPLDDTPSRPPDETLVTVLLVLAAVVAALLLWWVARRILAALRDTPPAPLDPDRIGPGDDLTATDVPTIALPELADAVTRALHHLDQAATPTDAVIAAWVALEDAAARHGTHRDPAQTTTEFTAAVLATVLADDPAPAAALTTLRTLYQHARFTDHPSTDTDVTAARTALVTIARTLDDAPGSTAHEPLGGQR